MIIIFVQQMFVLGEVVLMFHFHVLIMMDAAQLDAIWVMIMIAQPVLRIFNVMIIMLVQIMFV
jgi:hypothetical protein